MKRAACLVFLGGIASCALLSAGQDIPTFKSYGSGQSCGALLAATGQERERLDFWMLGFVSGAGYARMRSAPLTPTDPDGISAWVQRYCADHPLDGMTRAAVLLVQELAR